jgi:hypothetical protein
LKVKPILTNFNGGEWSPLLRGRVDLEKFPNSCIEMTNGFPTVYGTFQKRGGFHFIEEADSYDRDGEFYPKTVIVEFKAGNGKNYIIEFGDLKIRIFSGRRLLTKFDETSTAGFVPIEFVTDYPIYDVSQNIAFPQGLFFNGKKNIKTCQSADTMYIMHASGLLKMWKLSHFSETDWRLDEVHFENPPFDKVNVDENRILSCLGDTYSVGSSVLMSSVNEFPETVMPYDLEYTPLSDREMRIEWAIYSAAGTEVADFAGKGSQLNIERVISTLHDGIPNLFITREGSNIIIKDASITRQGVRVQLYIYYWRRVPGEDVPFYQTTNRYFTNVETVDFFKNIDVGRRIKLNLIDSNTLFWEPNKNINQIGLIRKSGNNYYISKNTGNTGTVKPTHTIGSVSDGTIYWDYLHSGYGSGYIVSYLSPSAVKILVESTLPPTISTYLWQWSLIEGQGHSAPVPQYPVDAAFHKGRLALLVNTSKGPAVALSMSDDYENFSDKSYGEITADCGIVAYVPGGRRNENNRGSWILSEGDLIIATEGDIFRFTEITKNQVLSPTNCMFIPVSDMGANQIRPLNVNGSIIFLDVKGRCLYELVVNNENVLIPISEISQLANHLFESPIVDIAYQRYPDTIIWLINKNGNLIGCSFNKQQQVVGFFKCLTKGSIGCIAVTDSPDNLTAELYAVICRSFSDLQYCSIEYLENGLPLSIPAEILNIDDEDEKEKAIAEYKLKNAFYLDGFSNSDLTGKNYMRFFADNPEGYPFKVTDESTIASSQNFDNAFCIHNENYRWRGMLGNNSQYFAARISIPIGSFAIRQLILDFKAASNYNFMRTYELFLPSGVKVGSTSFGTVPFGKHILNINIFYISMPTLILKCSEPFYPMPGIQIGPQAPSTIEVYAPDIYVEANALYRINYLPFLDGQKVTVVDNGKISEHVFNADSPFPATGTPDDFNHDIVFGTPYKAVLKPNALEVGASMGTAQGKPQRINKVVARVYDTAELKYGQDEKRMFEAKLEKNPDGTIKLNTVDYDCEGWDGNYDKTGAKMAFVSEKPLPLNIQALMVDVETYDTD